MHAANFPIHFEAILQMESSTYPQKSNKISKGGGGFKSRFKNLLFWFYNVQGSAVLCKMLKAAQSGLSSAKQTMTGGQLMGVKRHCSVWKLPIFPVMMMLRIRIGG